MTGAMNGASAGRVLRGVFLFLLIALMILLVFLTLRSLFFLASTDDGDTAGVESEPAGPTATLQLDSNATTAGGVSCGQPAGAASSEPFRIQFATSATEDTVVAVALVDEDGRRHPRQAIVAADGSEVTVQVVVPDSVPADGARYVACVITAIQRGKRVILTGQ